MLRGVALMAAMAGLGVCLAWVAMRVNKEQPEPYMVCARVCVAVQEINDV